MPLPPPYLGSSNNGGNGGNGGNGKSTSTSGSMNLGVGSLSIAALVLLHFMNWVWIVMLEFHNTYFRHRRILIYDIDSVIDKKHK